MSGVYKTIRPIPNRWQVSRGCQTRLSLLVANCRASDKYHWFRWPLASRVLWQLIKCRATSVLASAPLIFWGRLFTTLLCVTSWSCLGILFKQLQNIRKEKQVTWTCKQISWPVLQNDSRIIWQHDRNYFCSRFFNFLNYSGVDKT